MRFKLIGLAALFVFLTSMLHAQEFRATITGRVTDASGAVLAGAAVVATNQGTSQEASTVSDSAGVYTLPLLQPGTYTVSATANGFKKFVQAFSFHVGQVNVFFETLPLLDKNLEEIVG